MMMMMMQSRDQFLEALQRAKQTVPTDKRERIDILYHLLQWCIFAKDPQSGEDVHSLIRRYGLESDSFLGSHSIRMFALLGNIEEAKFAFRRLYRPSIHAWSAIISAHTMLGYSCEALHIYNDMKNVKRIRPDGHTFVAILKACANIGDLYHGMCIHGDIIEYGMKSNDYVQSGLIDMYIKCGCLMDAHLVFDRIVMPNVVIWSIMINGFAQHEQFKHVIDLFVDMQAKRVSLNPITYVCVLKACSSNRSLSNGMFVHHLLIIESFQSNAFVGSCLVDMYAKCGLLHDAHKVFEDLYKQDVTEWNAVIAGNTHHSQINKALQFYTQMQQEGVEPNQITLSCILKACADARSLHQGKCLHTLVMAKGLETDSFVSNVLINLYSRCGNLEYVGKVFEKSHKKNVVTWTSMIACYAEREQQCMAFHCFEKMKQEGIMPNNASFASVLKACSDIANLSLIHAYVIEHGCDSDATIARNLIDMYSFVKRFGDAHKVFNDIQEQDISIWNSLICGYAQHGRLENSVQLLNKMQEERIRPDNMTWNVIISGYTRHGRSLEALHLFQQMLWKGIEPDIITFVWVLMVCSMVISIQIGNILYGMIVESCLENDLHVREALLIMYMTCCNIEDAQKIFNELEFRSTRIWNAMMTGHEQVGHANDIFKCVYETMRDVDVEAKELGLWIKSPEFNDHPCNIDVVQLYCKMMQEDAEPDKFTFICVLRACSKILALNQGKIIYADILECCLDQDTLICNLIIEFFIRCGSLKDSYCVFEKLQKRSVVTYNTMIAACAQYGDLELAGDYFHAMKQEGVIADSVTFLCLLSTFSHFGKRTEALYYFNSMIDDYGIFPAFVHYTCIADLLGRIGLLKESEDLLQTMPFRSTIVGWTSLLSHCRIHGCLDIATQCMSSSSKKECRYAEYGITSGSD